MGASADQLTDRVSGDAILQRHDSEGVVTLTLNRPAQYNALSAEMLDALQSALDDIDSDPQNRVVIIAAIGKAFCPGHDLKEMRSSEEREFHQALFDKCEHMMLTINRLRDHHGLVNEVVPAAELASATQALAQKIVARSAHAIALGKDMFYRQLPMDLSAAYAYASERMVCNMGSADAREGIDAFIQKRQPVWSGK